MTSLGAAFGDSQKTMLQLFGVEFRLFARSNRAYKNGRAQMKPITTRQNIRYFGKHAFEIVLDETTQSCLC